MTDATLNPRRFYVYTLFREDGVTPFWIGRGCGKRWRRHEYEVQPGKTHKDNIVWGMKSRGIEVPKEKLLENLTLREAIEIEADLIRLVMRGPHGPLVNIVGGGGGLPDPPESTRAKLSAAHRGKKRSEETRARMRAAAKLRSPERLERQRAILRSPEVRAKMSASRRGKPKSPEHRAKMKARAQNMSAETRAKMGAARRGKIASEETRQKLREAATNISPETRAKIGAASRGRRHTDETKEILRRKSAMHRHSAETLAKMSEAQISAWKRRKTQRR